MIDPKRLQGIAIALTGVLVAFATLNATLTVAVGPASRWLHHGENPTDWLVYDDVGGKLSAIARNGQAGTERPIGILLGQSTLNGIDPEELTRAVPDGPRWLNLSGVGGSINRIKDLSDLVEFSGTRPAEVVLGINPYMLAGTPYEATLDFQRRRSSTFRLKQAVWTWQNKDNVNHLFRQVLYQARMGLFRSTGHGADALFPPARDPWVLPRQHVANRRLKPDELKERLDYNAGLGWYDPARYAATNSNSESLDALIRGWLARGAKVRVVLLPESSDQRAQMPAEARRLLESIVRDASGSAQVPIVDLGDTQPDDAFLDLDHLNPKGNAGTLALIAAALRGDPPRP